MTPISRIATLSSALAVAGFASPAPAAETYDSCAFTISSLPTVITASGVYCLKGDLSTNVASGAAIAIAANNVTVDCNSFKIGGLGAGAATLAVGIRVETRRNAVVRGCSIRGFNVGIGIYDGLGAAGGSGHVIEDNRVEGSTARGIDVRAPASVVRRNIVMDTGGAPVAVAMSGTGIRAQFGTDVLDNTVAGVGPGAAGGNAIGIHALHDAGATIASNRINTLAPVGGLAFGVIDENGGTIVADNVVMGPANGSGVGIACGSVTSTVARNVVRGFAASVSVDCFANGNITNAN